MLLDGEQYGIREGDKYPGLERELPIAAKLRDALLEAEDTKATKNLADEFPGRVQVLFDAAASHYLPTEDLSGVGDWLAHQLKFAR